MDMPMATALALVAASPSSSSSPVAAVPMSPFQGDTVPHWLALIMCPTALGTGRWQLHLLAYLYLATGLFALWELARSVGGGYQLLSFRNVFIMLAAWLMLHRFFLAFVPLEPWLLFSLMFFVLVFPLFLQVATWSLLVIFLAKALYVLRGQFAYVRSRLYPIAAVTLGITLIISVAMSALTATFWRPPTAGEFDRHVALFAGVSFFVLVSVIGVYGVRTYRVLARASFSQSERRRQRNRRIVALASFYWLIFLVRATWNVLYFGGVNPIQRQLSKWASSDDPLQQNYYFWGYLIFYVLMELLPMSAVILTIRTLLPRSRRANNVPTKAATAAAVAAVAAANNAGSASQHQNYGATTSDGGV